MDKKIDLIIPAYKTLHTLDRCLSSIAMQTIKDKVKITIVDDCSGDNYDSLINFWNKLLDINVYYCDKNGGPGAARRIGVEITNLPYITFMDSDDTLANSFVLETLLNEFLDENVKQVIGTFMEETKNNNISDIIHKTIFVPHNINYTWVFGKMYERKFLEEEGINFNDTRANEDTGFNTKIVLSVKNIDLNIKFLSFICYSWHFKEDSITRINDHEYTYGKGFEGYLYNMKESLLFAKEKHPENMLRIINLTIEVLTEAFASFRECSARKPADLNGMCKPIKDYYKDAFMPIIDNLTIDKDMCISYLSSRKQKILIEDDNRSYNMFCNFIEALKTNKSNKYLINSFSYINPNQTK